MGHLVRCRALAGMLKDDFCCTFANDLPFATFLEQLTGAEIVVLDNYFYDTAKQQAVKDKGCLLVCIDDIHATHFVADAVVNHAGGIDKALYRTAPYTQLYLGPQYVLLRPEFLKAAAPKAEITADNRELFICLGGADPNNDTLDLLKWMEEKAMAYTCHLVLGSAYSHKEALDAFLSTTDLPVKLYYNLSPEDMVALMQQCGRAICPPSTVSMEYLTVSAGKLYLRMVADNQKDVHAFYLSTGLALDYPALADEPGPQSASRTCFDGKSGGRLLRIFKQLERERGLLLRKAVLNDAELYFRWVNDPQSRQNALNPKTISYEEHLRWFAARCADPAAFLWIMEQGGQPVGQVRFEVDEKEKEVVISYAMAPEFRGQGLGTSLLRLGIAAFARQVPGGIRLKGLVKLSNTASCQIFETLNFTAGPADPSTPPGFISYSKTL